jgi:hypothetical protein
MQHEYLPYSLHWGIRLGELSCLTVVAVLSSGTETWQNKKVNLLSDAYIQQTPLYLACMEIVFPFHQKNVQI